MHLGVSAIKPLDDRNEPNLNLKLPSINGRLVGTQNNALTSPFWMDLCSSTDSQINVRQTLGLRLLVERGVSSRVESGRRCLASLLGDAVPVL